MPYLPPEEPDAGPVLTAEPWERSVRLAFSGYEATDDHVGEYVVSADADGLAAQSTVVTTLGGDGLAEFIQKLADDFRGWPGTRHWRSLEDQLQIEASWQSGGHVALRFQIRLSVYDKWAVFGGYDCRGR
jgi:hypothetical protein